MLDWFPFKTFTTIQNKVMTAILNSDANLLLCARTGAGKTAKADTAILPHSVSKALKEKKDDSNELR